MALSIVGIILLGYLNPNTSSARFMDITTNFTAFASFLFFPAIILSIVGFRSSSKKTVAMWATIVSLLSFVISVLSMGILFLSAIV